MRTRQLLSLVGAWTLLASVPSPVLAQNIIFDSVSVTNLDDLTVMIEVDGNGFIRRSRAFNVKIGGEVQTENCTVLSNVLFNCQVMAEHYPPGEYVMSAWHGRASRLNQKVLSVTSFTISPGDVAPGAGPRGPAGLAGPPGTDGVAGADGAPGADDADGCHAAN